MHGPDVGGVPVAVDDGLCAVVLLFLSDAVNHGGNVGSGPLLWTDLDGLHRSREIRRRGKPLVGYKAVADIVRRVPQVPAVADLGPLPKLEVALGELGGRGLLFLCSLLLRQGAFVLVLVSGAVLAVLVLDVVFLVLRQHLPLLGDALELVQGRGGGEERESPGDGRLGAPRPEPKAKDGIDRGGTAAHVGLSGG